MPDIDTDTPEKQEGRPFPIPPATFEFLAESMRLQAEMQLGLMRLGAEEHPPADLDLARHTIDLMAMLQEKTRGNLSLEEQRLLDNSLTLLRFRYVQVAGEAQKASKPAESPQPETEQADSQKA
jgi:hypothetical protein